VAVELGVAVVMMISADRVTIQILAESGNEVSNPFF